MSYFRRNTNQVKPDYTGLQIQTATSTLPIPIVWGQSKVGGNVIWYYGFTAVPSSGGKGGGKGGGGASAATSYNYVANVAIALCEGPVAAVPLVYKDQSLYLYQWLGFNLYTGTTPQDVWPGFTAWASSQALAYQGTAFVAAVQYNLGDTASLGNHNFEVQGPLAGTGVNGIDADPALVIYDFLTNEQYGAQFDAANINSATLFGSGGDASLQTYCRATGIAFSPALTSQEQASSILTRWLQICNCAAVWSGGMLSFIPYSDSAVASGASQTITAQFTIPRPIPPTSSGEPEVPATVPVCAAAQFVTDGGVQYASTGASFVFLPGVTILTVAGTYGMSPSGTYIFAPLDEGMAVIITYTVQSTTGFTPNLTPVYALGDNNVVDEKGNKDPIQVERADVFSLPTIQRVEVLSRSNWYSPIPVEARDQSQIEVYGPRVAPVVQAHEICDEFTIGPIVAQTILQRELYVRTKFTFKLSWEYCLLDPMDVVTITDANLGLSNYPVRIISIEEDDRGVLTITAEEFVTGVSTPAYNPSASAGSVAPEWGVPAVPVNTPLIFQPPVTLTNGTSQIWFGASGQGGGGQNQWGGCDIYVSVDNVSYTQIETINSPLRQGVLSAALGFGFGWDATNTLSVNLSESLETLAGTTQAAAEQGATLSLVDNELLAYENATLTSANAYNLTGLARGLAGTNPTTHATGAPFARLDGAIVQYDLPANLAGQTLYFKFQSFNAFGEGLQELSNCVAYTFTPTTAAGGSLTSAGSGSRGGSGGSSSSTSAGSSSGGSSPSTTQTPYPIGGQIASGFPLDLGSVNANPTIADDFGSVSASVTANVDLGAVLVGANPIGAALLSGVAVDLGLTTSAVTIADDFGSTADAVVDVINLGTAP